MNDIHLPQPAKQHEEQWSPADVLGLVLSKIESDGSVRFKDMQTEIIMPPHAPVDVQGLPDHAYSVTLLHVARTIFHLCQQLNLGGRQRMEWPIRSAAHLLTAYRHDVAFLREALALIVPTDSGWTRPPSLPSGYGYERAMRREHTIT